VGECKIWLAAPAGLEDVSSGNRTVATLDAGLSFVLPEDVLICSDFPAENLARLAAVDARAESGAIPAETLLGERCEEPVQLCASDCVN